MPPTTILGPSGPLILQFGEAKANGRGVVNPEYERLAPNKFRDRAILLDHFFFGRD